MPDSQKCCTNLKNIPRSIRYTLTILVAFISISLFVILTSVKKPNLSFNFVYASFNFLISTIKESA